ncbi:hypothetical protein AXF42_Ash002652 [Apostasia shenzhenica]|uniref:Uncharacterized protein n=1 Tax=Apostasia shenzhenica TaxID=1088818 RepID=A0A2I0A6V8_9ASPA|nr:hypothetical protein AXF42_Ash002652 [Apostasia shenzhenica]
MAERKKWVTLSSFSKKRVSNLPVDAPPAEKRRLLEPSEGSSKPATTNSVEALQKEEVGPAVLAQTLESVQELAGAEATEVVNVSDSPVKPPLKAGERKEVILVSETVTGEKLAPGKILLKNEEVERLLPKFEVPSAEGVKRTGHPSRFAVPLLLVYQSLLLRRKGSPSSLLSFQRISEMTRKRKKREGRRRAVRWRRLRGRTWPLRLLPESPLALKGQEARWRK